jgi:hypothetical protein
LKGDLDALSRHGDALPLALACADDAPTPKRVAYLECAG